MGGLPSDRFGNAELAPDAIVPSGSRGRVSLDMLYGAGA